MLRNKGWSIRVLAVVAALFTWQTAGAEIVPKIKPGDPKLVVFPYDAHNSYRILTRPRAATHIELMPDERVRIFALGDTVSWQSVEKENHVFIKPVYPNQTVAGTLVTNKRTYQLLLQSGTETSHFYQHVSFLYPDLIAAENRQSDLERLAGDAVHRGKSPGEPSAEASNGHVVDVTKLNFAYEFEGDASFKPAQVYDDGRSTFIRFDPNVLDLPALFRIREGAAIELVEYTSQGSMLIVPRVLEGGLLKLGEAEVRFRNMTRTKKTWLGRYEPMGH